MSPRRRTSRLVLPWLPLLLSPLLSAQGARISLPLPRQPGFSNEDTLAFRSSSDGRWVVFVADDETDELFELYSAPTDGSAPARKLSGTLVAGGHLVEVQDPPPYTSYDGPYLETSATHVAYRADQETDRVHELFCAPLDGSAPAVKVSGTLGSNGNVGHAFAFALDGARVVFRADASVDERHELFSAPVDGSALPLRLSAPLGAWGEVLSDPPLVTPDGATVVYRAVVPPSQSARLYAVPADGGAPPRRLSGPAVESMRLVPDGSGVVYRAWESSSSLWLELWWAPLDGSVPARRLDARAGVGSVWAFAVSPDSTRAVYQADHALANVLELWSVPLDGSALALRLNPPLAEGHGTLLRAFAFSTDGVHVAYVADAGAPDARELFAVRADGGTSAVRLSAPAVAGGGVEGGGLEHALEVGAEHAVWVADLGDGVNELFAAPLDGSQPARRLSTPLPPGGHVGDGYAWAFRLAPDGRRVAYWADASAPGYRELRLVPADGSAPARRLSGPLSYPGSVDAESYWGIEEGFAFTPDGARLLYRADQQIDERHDLWSVRLDAPGLARRLNQELEPGPVVGAVRDFAWSTHTGGLVYTDGTHVLALGVGAYAAPGPTSFRLLGSGSSLRLSPGGERVAFRPFPSCDFMYCTPSAPLWCAPVDGGSPAAVLNAGLPGFASVGPFTPDGAQVVFLESASGFRWSASGLFQSPSDGSAPPLSLTEPAGMLSYPPWAVGRHALTADGLRVVYRLDGDSGPALLAVPLDRSQAPARLHPVLGFERQIQAFEPTLDSTRALFVADLDVAGVFELHVAPLDASTPPARLHPSLPADRDVDAAFVLTPDGEHVLAVADLEQDEAFELWRLPLDALHGSPALRLSGKSTPGGGVTRGLARTSGLDAGVPLPQIATSPDGKHVVYRADARVDEQHELWSVLLDGSEAPVRLHPAIAPAEDVPLFGFQVGPGFVVFGVEDALGATRLFRAPLDGSAPALLLSGSFVPGGGLWRHAHDGLALSFALSPDGAHVAYLADASADEVYELFLVPSDGSRPPRRLNGAQAPGGDVGPVEANPRYGPFAFSPDGRFVAYQADSLADGVRELFLASVAPLKLRPGRAPSR